MLDKLANSGLSTPSIIDNKLWYSHINCNILWSQYVPIFPFFNKAEQGVAINFLLNCSFQQHFS